MCAAQRPKTKIDRHGTPLALEVAGAAVLPPPAAHITGMNESVRP